MAVVYVSLWVRACLGAEIFMCNLIIRRRARVEGFILRAWLKRYDDKEVKVNQITLSHFRAAERFLQD